MIPCTWGFLRHMIGMGLKCLAKHLSSFVFSPSTTSWGLGIHMFFFFRAVTTIYIYISAASRRSRACVLGLGLNWQHVLNFYVKKKGKRMFESRFQTKLTKAIGNMLQPLQRGKKLTIQKRNWQTPFFTLDPIQDPSSKETHAANVSDAAPVAEAGSDFFFQWIFEASWISG